MNRESATVNIEISLSNAPDLQQHNQSTRYRKEHLGQVCQEDYVQREIRKQKIDVVLAGLEMVNVPLCSEHEVVSV